VIIILFFFCILILPNILPSMIEILRVHIRVELIIFAAPRLKLCLVVPLKGKMNEGNEILQHSKYKLNEKKKISCKI